MLVLSSVDATMRKRGTPQLLCPSTHDASCSSRTSIFVSVRNVSEAGWVALDAWALIQATVSF